MTLSELIAEGYYLSQDGDTFDIALRCDEPHVVACPTFGLLQVDGNFTPEELQAVLTWYREKQAQDEAREQAEREAYPGLPSGALD